MCIRDSTRAIRIQREEKAEKILQANNVEGVRSGSNQPEEEDYDWIPFSSDPAENFRIAYNKRNPPELWIPSRSNRNQNNNEDENRVAVHENPGFSLLRNQASNDEGPRIARVNHVLAEASQEPNNDPSNENNLEDQFRYAERIWPEHVVRW